VPLQLAIAYTAIKSELYLVSIAIAYLSSIAIAYTAIKSNQTQMRTGKTCLIGVTLDKIPE
jgi:hypothetical protein